MEDDWRSREIKISEDYAWLRRVTRGAVLIAIGIFIGMIIYADPASRQAYVINIFTSALSLFATALIFDELNRQRSEREHKRQLVDDAASTSNEIAKNAVHQLFRKRWLRFEKGLLKGADLIDANLNGAFLQWANLQEARLDFAHLQKADLVYADLQGANLMFADLREADLQGVDFRGANLTGTNLKEAGQRRFGYIILARFDENTILPDESKWSAGIDMRRFTHPEHPDFWQHPQWREDSEE